VTCRPHHHALRRIFLADVTPSTNSGNSPRVTLASEAIVVPDAAQNRLQLSLTNPACMSGKDPSEYNVTSRPAARDPEASAIAKCAVKPVIEWTRCRLYRLAYARRNPSARGGSHRTGINAWLMPLAACFLALTGFRWESDRALRKIVRIRPDGRSCVSCTSWD